MANCWKHLYFFLQRKMKQNIFDLFKLFVFLLFFQLRLSLTIFGNTCCMKSNEFFIRFEKFFGFSYKQRKAQFIFGNAVFQRIECKKFLAELAFILINIRNRYAIVQCYQQNRRSLYSFTMTKYSLQESQTESGLKCTQYAEPISMCMYICVYNVQCAMCMYVHSIRIQWMRICVLQQRFPQAYCILRCQHMHNGSMLSALLYIYFVELFILEAICVCSSCI